MSFITPAISLSREERFTRFVGALRTRVAGYDPSDGGLVTWVGETIADLLPELAEMATETLVEDLRYFGLQLANIEYQDATYATGAVTITGTAGQVVPAGTRMYGILGDTRIGFTTVDAATLTGGTAAGVAIIADEPGETANQVDGTLTLQDRYAFVASVGLDAPTSGGVDAEGAAVYLDRLSERLQVSNETPIKPRHFVILAKQVPGVWRAVVVDGYDPDENPGTYDPDDMNTWALGAVAIAAIDDDGEDVTGAVETALDVFFNGNGTTIEPLREVGFVTNIINSTYHTIDITFKFKAAEGYDPVDVKAAGEAAIATYLHPGNRGVSRTDASGRSWKIDRKVRVGEIHALLDREVDGLEYAEDVMIEGVADDYDLTGLVPLTRAGTITGTAL